ncbi:MAG: hypothetical protein II702_01800, partial [Clostridia bacterium]|nr:hypothetical protein [Clostridia bacterium]
MKRLLKSFRENRIICVTALVLAVLQAVCCLAVPVLIGRAVGTGLQGKGYPDSYPIGMSRDAFALFLLVLPEEKGAQLSGLYELKDESPYSANGKYATNKKCFWLKDNADMQTARELFCDAATCALYEINKTTNLKSLDSYNMFAEKISMRSLLIYAGRLNLTESDRAECYEAAQRADGLLKQQVAAVFLPYIYADAGMDCDAVQSAYLTKSLIKIIAVSALQFACAVVSGIFTAKCSTDAESSLRGELRNRLFSFSENGKGKFSAEEIRDIYQNSVARVGISLNFLISLIVYSVSVILIGGIMTFINQRFISLLILLCAVAVFIVIFVVYKLSYGKYLRMDENYLEYSETIEEQLADIIQIRAEKGEYFVKEKVANASAGIRRDERSVMKSVYFAVGSIGFFVNILTAAVVLW